MHMDASDEDDIRDLTKKQKVLYNGLKRKMKRIDWDESDEEGDNTSKFDDITSSKSTSSRRHKAKKHQLGNKNASKDLRKIEIGWVHNDKSVRAVKGGGTRKLDVPNDATPEQILQAGKRRFFPNGKSLKGLNASDCTFDIYDFSHTKVPEDESLLRIHERVKPLGILRFYVYTTTPKKSDLTDTDHEKTNQTQTNQETSVNEKSDVYQVLGSYTKENTTFFVLDATNSDSEPTPRQEDEPNSSLSDTLPLDVSNRLEETKDKKNITSKPSVSLAIPSDVENVLQEKTVASNISPTATRPLDVRNILEDDENKKTMTSNVSLSATLPLDLDDLVEVEGQNILKQESSIMDTGDVAPPRSPTPPPTTLAAPIAPLWPSSNSLRNIRIHRVNIEQEMILNFVDPSVMDEQLTFQFVDEKGVDADGLSREAYACFWESFMESSTKGEAERIPCLSPHMQKMEWQAIGRILNKGYIDQGIYPLQLSKAFTIAMIHGEETVSSDILLSSFMHYISPPEWEAVEKALAGQLEDEEDREDFIDVLDRMDCKTIPKPDEMRSTILDIARKELIQTGKYALDAIASTSRDGLCSRLPNVQSVDDMYDAKIPTVRKVIKLFQPQETGLEQDKCLGYLKQYVRGLDTPTLKRFLRHVTGADVICVDKIEVHFNSRRGIGRIPVVRTCTPMIELSSTYASYTELRSEFTNLLAVHHPLDID